MPSKQGSTLQWPWGMRQCRYSTMTPCSTPASWCVLGQNVLGSQTSTQSSAAVSPQASHVTPCLPALFTHATQPVASSMDPHAAPGVSGAAICSDRGAPCAAVAAPSEGGERRFGGRQRTFPAKGKHWSHTTQVASGTFGGLDLDCPRVRLHTRRAPAGHSLPVRRDTRAGRLHRQSLSHSHSGVGAHCRYVGARHFGAAEPSRHRLDKGRPLQPPAALDAAWCTAQS
jgi:hypothetical protein